MSSFAPPYARGPFRRRPGKPPQDGATAIPAPSAPATPNTPSPADTATAYYTLLSWASSGQVTADIYFGTSPSPPLLVPQYSGFSYVPTVSAGTTYYWKIVAFNTGGSATGPVWSFTTPAATAIHVEVNGSIVTPTVRFGSLRVRDILGPQPNTATLVFDTSAPTGGEQIKIGLGTLDANNLIFGGEVQGFDQTYAGTAASNTFYPVTLIDHSFRLNKKRPFGSFVSTSASVIARALLATYATGFTANHVQDGLPAISINFDGSQDFMSCIKALADAISDTTRTAKVRLDYSRDLHLFFSEDTTAPNPVDLTHPPLQAPSPIAFSLDHSQLRTVVYGKGHGEKLVTDVGGRETILPIADSVMFNPAGGLAIAATTSDGAQTQILTYDGVQAGGGGSVVGPGASPSTGPTATTAAGTGIDVGTHQWAYTDVTASGESLPSPLTTKVVAATLPTPGGFGGNTNTPGNDLSVGTYKWAITDVNAAGETDPSPQATLITDGQIADPTTAPGVNNSSLTGSWSGTDGNIHDISYVYRNSDGTFHTAPSPRVSAILLHTGNPYKGAIATGPCSSDARVAAVDLYDFPAGWIKVGSAANVPGTNFSITFDYADGSGSAPTNNYVFRRPVLTSLPVGPASTTARKLYRTVANGSQLKLLATLDNVVTTYTDTTADASLGANAPTSNTATAAQIALTSIAVGPTGTTQRKVYRTAANASQLKLLTTLADNATTTFTDNVADSALGANAPSSDNSGLTQPSGQVVAGSTSLPTASAGPFNSATGGWALLSGGQCIRYTGISTNTLTGIPASGPGAILTTVLYGSQVLPAPALTNINAGNGVPVALAKGSSVNIWVKRQDTNAQAALGALEKNADGTASDGIREYLISDGRLGEPLLTTLCDASLAIFSRPIVTATYYTRDPKTASGKSVSINLAWGQVGTFTIQSVDIVVDAINVNPLYHVTATSVAFTLSDLLRRVSFS